jgi:hypothetical protein
MPECCHGVFTYGGFTPLEQIGNVSFSKASTARNVSDNAAAIPI